MFLSKNVVNSNENVVNKPFMILAFMIFLSKNVVNSNENVVNNILLILANISKNLDCYFPLNLL